MSICVTDADAGLAFYRDVLGCTPLPRPDLGPGHWLDAGGQQVHLMQSDDPPPRSNHFAFRVDDLDAVVEELRGKGVDGASRSRTSKARAGRRSCTIPSATSSSSTSRTEPVGEERRADPLGRQVVVAGGIEPLRVRHVAVAPADEAETLVQSLRGFHPPRRVDQHRAVAARARGSRAPTRRRCRARARDTSTASSRNCSSPGSVHSSQRDSGSLTNVTAPRTASCGSTATSTSHDSARARDVADVGLVAAPEVVDGQRVGTPRR